jgi:hypothetical protein
MANIQVTVINSSTVLTDDQVQAVVPAIQTQVRRDFLPVWGIDADVIFVPQGAAPAANAWWLTILDDSDQADALGYHETTNSGLPLSKVFAKTAIQDGVQWTVTTSHELLEMLVDPEINLSVFIQPTDFTGTLYSYEVCDSCEADQFGYDINGILVSDFVYPAWFEASRLPGSAQFDFAKQLQSPLPQLLPGGYIGAFDVGSGSGWHQVSAMLHQSIIGARRVNPPRGSRRDRRALPRSQWRKSLARFGTSSLAMPPLTPGVPLASAGTALNGSGAAKIAFGGVGAIRAPMGARTIEGLRRIGSRPNVVQIVPPRQVFRPAYLRAADRNDNELITRPLSSPTGPGGAAGFKNRAGSQIASPKTTNIYMGPFWGNKPFFEGFCKAIAENGYLDPLKELGYGTGSGSYMGPIEGVPLLAGTTFSDSDARTEITKMLDGGTLQADANSLLMLVLPEGVDSRFDGDGSMSCSSFCGYHESFNWNGIDVAYAIMPSPTGCDGCGNGNIGDFTAVYAHELAESCTDKVPGQGWVAEDGQENGDLEAWIMFPWGPPEDPQRYTIQGYYTNERGNTVGAWRDAASP